MALELYHSHMAYRVFTNAFFSNKFNIIHMHVRFRLVGEDTYPLNPPLLKATVQFGKINLF